MWHHGRAAGATPLVERLHAVSAQTGVALNSTMLDTIASVYLDTGELSRAESIALQMLDPATVEAEARARPEAMLTLARIRRRQDRPDQALDLVQQAERLARHRRLPELTATATMDKARLLAAKNDHKGAYDALSESYATWVKVRNGDAEARAASLHALFETEQARQRSARFEQLAERDALTGLWNRRHLDRVLPGLLLRSEATTAPLSLAILDVDHFKRINDQRGHLTGDATLTRLGELLQQLLPEPGYIARLGGEEFVLVMPNTDPAAAYTVCEAARVMIAEQQWDPITDGLPVTVSIGVATAAHPSTVSAVLSAADAALYRAKGQRSKPGPTTRCASTAWASPHNDRCR